VLQAFTQDFIGGVFVNAEKVQIAPAFQQNQHW